MQQISKVIRPLFVVLLLLASHLSNAQTLVTQPMTGTPTAGEYYNPTSITLNPGFSFTATTGQSFRAYISTANCLPLATAPTTSQNYVLTTVLRVPNIKTEAALAGLNTCDAMQSILYADGLGRPIQTVQVKGSNDATKDIIQPVAYDEFGREIYKFLPYAASGIANGAFRQSAITEQGNYYKPAGTTGTQQANGVAVIPNPFSVSLLEMSQLNKVLEQGAPGNAWQPYNSNIANSGHTIKMAELTNNTLAFSDTANSRIVSMFTVGAANATTGQPTLLRQGNYEANQLMVNITRDENWKSGRGGTTEEYKDKEGKVVLKRTFNYTSGTLQILSTYYVYDDMSNLRFVLPPKIDGDGSVLPTATVLNNLAYQYSYDHRNRLVIKKLPGKGIDYMIYNELDQVIATQDGIQRGKTMQEWTVTKYDALGRVVLTGIYQYGAAGAYSRTDVQSQANGFATLWESPTGASANNGYTNAAFPASNITQTLSVNYYDNYTIADKPAYVAPANASSMTKGLLTASKINVLGTGNMLWNVNYYDESGRVIKTYGQHYRKGLLSNNNYDEVSNTYNFTDQVTTINRKHYTDGTGLTLTINNRFDYDHMGRKTKTWQQTGISTSPEILLSSLTYNEIGQLWKKGLHSENSGSTYLQEVTNTYNERGWVNASGSILFNMSLAYDAPGTGGKAKYNGNISQMVYSKTGAGNITMLYNYDQLNRLTNSTSTGNLLNETLSYDVMGNITSLARTGTRTADLAYTYYNANMDNRLQTVTNNGNALRSYSYDANGNATTAGVSSKAITYNLLNLPATVKNGSTTIATYTYDAAGNKLRNTGSDGNHDYIGGIQYDSDSQGIAFVATEEGRARNNGGTYSYEYNLKDHLGNVRVSFDKDPTTNAARNVLEDEYYPFGLRKPMSNYSNNNRYLYNGKELQTDLTDQYDYGARFYDPLIGRWASPDPMSDRYLNSSNYAYCKNDPVVFIDPDGRKILFVNGFWAPGFIGSIIGSPAPRTSYWEPVLQKQHKIFFMITRQLTKIIISMDRQVGVETKAVPTAST